MRGGRRRLGVVPVHRERRTSGAGITTSRLRIVSLTPDMLHAGSGIRGVMHSTLEGEKRQHRRFLQVCKEGACGAKGGADTALDASSEQRVERPLAVYRARGLRHNQRDHPHRHERSCDGGRRQPLPHPGGILTAFGPVTISHAVLGDSRDENRAGGGFPPLTMPVVIQICQDSSPAAKVGVR